MTHAVGLYGLFENGPMGSRPNTTKAHDWEISGNPVPTVQEPNQARKRAAGPATGLANTSRKEAATHNLDAGTLCIHATPNQSNYVLGKMDRGV
jgi:hypothetical protein